MLSRRNIRIKVLQQLYAFQQQDAKSVPVFQKALENQFSDFYKFYYFSLQFLIDFNTFMESEKELELEKYFPNKTHIRNAEVLKRVDFFNSLSESTNFQEVCGKLPYDWRRHGDMFNRIFIDVVQYDFFIDFCVFDDFHDSLVDLYAVIFFVILKWSSMFFMMFVIIAWIYRFFMIFLILNWFQ